MSDIYIQHDLIIRIITHPTKIFTRFFFFLAVTIVHGNSVGVGFIRMDRSHNAFMQSIMIKTNYQLPWDIVLQKKKKKTVKS